MKTSNALILAWLVVVLVLGGVVAFFALKSPSPTPVPDQPVKPVKNVPKPPKPAVPPRGTSRHSQQPPPPPAIRQITGLVKDAAGKPVQGAHVALFLPVRPSKPTDAPNMEEVQRVNSMVYVPPEEWDHPRRLDAWTAPEGDALHAEPESASAETAADGTFTITLGQQLPTGPWRLTAAKEGVGTGAVASTRVGEKVEVVLGTASGLKGQVLTQINSQPVPGARVVLDTGGRRISAVTDPQGRFEMQGVTPGVYQVSVAAKGFTPLFETRKIPVNETNLALRLPRGTTLRVKAVLISAGEVVRKDTLREGDPVPGAEIVALHEDSLAYVLGKTNAEGVAEFQGMPGGRYVVNGTAKGFVSEGEVPLVVDPQKETAEVTVDFAVAVDTPVEVVDEEGHPVAGMDFYTQTSESKYDAVRSQKVAVTDGDGKFRYPFEFDGPRAGLYGFKTGYAVVSAMPDDNESGELVKLVAKKALRVHGTVKTSEGRPVANAVVTIEVSPSDPEALEMSLDVRADAQGAYDFAFLPRLDGITLMASAPDGSAEGEQELELAPDKTEYAVDLVLDTEQAAPTPPKKK
jgi:carboxypeptidase family protein